MMEVVLKQTNLVQRIDSRAKSILVKGGDEELLSSLYDVMDDIKKIMDSNTQDAMDIFCSQYDGFYRYMKLLEKLAAGIAGGKFNDLLR